MPLGGVKNAFLHFRFLRHAAGHEVDRGIESEISFLKMFFGLVEETGLLNRNVDQSRLGAVRNGVPAVAAQWSWGERSCFAAFITCACVLERTARRGIDSSCPGDRGVRLGGNDLACGAIEDVKESVLKGLEENFSPSASDRDIGEDHRCGGIVVPGIPWHFLIMPNVFAGVGLKRHDRAGEQIVFALRAARAAVPRSSIARSDVDELEFGIVDHRIPHRSAASKLPPIAGPSRGCFRERGTFERFRWIAWNGVEAPRQVARLRVVGGNVTAHTECSAAVADKHPALYHAWCAGDGVTIFRIDGECLPNWFSGRGVERNEA